MCFTDQIRFVLLAVIPLGVFAQTENTSTPSWTTADAFVAADAKGWPEVRAEARPGAYWWWPGNAVTKKDLTWNLETYRKAGWGNMGVIGIYGVKGEEARSIDIFSPKWFEMYNHAVTEAKRLDVNIDLTPGSGWRLGGPHITRNQAEQSFSVKDGQLQIKTRSDKVKRAGPGGQGLCVNPYSQSAVDFHFDWIARRFEENQGLAPRAFYYDSFENPGNWCPEFLESFQQLRGYDLNDHLAALGGKGDADEVRRVLCDYRETLSDLLLGRVGEIVDWGRERGSSLRMQAHGAPANLLDMYAAAGIPETEVFGASIFDIPGYRREKQWIREDRQSDLVNRFASSAAHVAGRPLVISESFTWLRNHFHTALSHIKAESDKLWLNGINGIYYHGLCFAPEKTEWPGWLFYASTQANARNSIFRDIPALNTYMTRCQGMLQEGRPANDILLYWPVYDQWMNPMTGRMGAAWSKPSGDHLEIRVQLHPGETRFLRVRPNGGQPLSPWPLRNPVGDAVPVSGTWQVEFVEGGPVLPPAFTTERLGCWTQQDDADAQRFAGAARYTISVDLPECKADGWILDLGDVRESARVWVNGSPAGVVFAHPFRLDLGTLLKPGGNELVIEVTNLSANRIRDLDRRKVPWKKFHDINFVSHLYKPFDASEWELKPSGLLGPVTLRAEVRSQ